MSYTRSRKHDDYEYIKSTALHIAVEKGNIEIIQSLVDHKGIDINIRDEIMLFYFSIMFEFHN